jgi:hypothetical protein
MKVLLPSEIRLDNSKDLIPVSFKINGFTSLEAVIAKLKHRYSIDTNIYEICVIIAGKQIKNYATSINTIIPTIETMIHVIVRKPPKKSAITPPINPNYGSEVA